MIKTDFSKLLAISCCGNLMAKLRVIMSSAAKKKQLNKNNKIIGNVPNLNWFQNKPKLYSNKI